MIRCSIVGAGIIGLAALAAVRASVPGVRGDDHRAPRVPGAGRARRGRASRRARAGSRARTSRSWPRISGAKVSGRGRGQMLLGGFPYVIEAVGGLESVTESIRLVDYWGTVLFIGAGGMGEVDLSALWFKEAELVGAWNHSHGVHPTRGTHHSIDLALEVLANGGLPESVVTHDVRARRSARSGRDRDRQAQRARDQGRVPPQRLSDSIERYAGGATTVDRDRRNRRERARRVRRSAPSSRPREAEAGTRTGRSTSRSSRAAVKRVLALADREGQRAPARHSGREDAGSSGCRGLLERDRPLRPAHLPPARSRSGLRVSLSTTKKPVIGGARDDRGRSAARCEPSRARTAAVGPVGSVAAGRVAERERATRVGRRAGSPAPSGSR